MEITKSEERWKQTPLPLPNPKGTPIKFGDLPEGEICYIYGDCGACHCYKKVHPQDDGHKNEVNAFLLGEPELQSGRKVWISRTVTVYLRLFCGGRLESAGA